MAFQTEEVQGNLISEVEDSQKDVTSERMEKIYSAELMDFVEQSARLFQDFRVSEPA